MARALAIGVFLGLIAGSQVMGPVFGWEHDSWFDREAVRAAAAGFLVGAAGIIAMLVEHEVGRRPSSRKLAFSCVLGIVAAYAALHAMTLPLWEVGVLMIAPGAAVVLSMALAAVFVRLRTGRHIVVAGAMVLVNGTVAWAVIEPVRRELVAWDLRTGGTLSTYEAEQRTLDQRDVARGD